MTNMFELRTLFRLKVMNCYFIKKFIHIQIIFFSFLGTEDPPAPAATPPSPPQPRNEMKKKNRVVYNVCVYIQFVCVCV